MTLQQPLCKQEGANSNKIFFLRDKNDEPNPHFLIHMKMKVFFIEK